jgi:predicted enzyme related to lactoylglutathione lyase
MTEVHEVAPVLPVRDLDAALAHYARLGFTTWSHDLGYAIAERDDVHLHLSRVEHIDPATSVVSVYLYVADADALAAEWRSSGALGVFVDPVDTDYGLREGAHIDPDGNLLRYGSPLPGRA